MIGVVKTELVESQRIVAEDLGPIVDAIGRVQQELFDIGAECATLPGRAPEKMEVIGNAECERLLYELDGWLEGSQPLESFILPAGTPPIASMHAARTAIRQAETMVRSRGNKCGLCGAFGVNKTTCPGNEMERSELDGNMKLINEKHQDMCTNFWAREEIICYLNRLSDWMFALGRKISDLTGDEEFLWVPKGKREDWLEIPTGQS
jgi:cob(I)alamin adenosyltransferase